MILIKPNQLKKQKTKPQCPKKLRYWGNSKPKATLFTENDLKTEYKILSFY